MRTPAENRDLLFSQAQEEGYASVMLLLVRYSLTDLSSISAEQRQVAVEQRMAAVHALLGDQALREGEWISAMGQAGILVTAQGLRMLEQSQGLVLSIQMDSTREMRDLAWTPQDHRLPIRDALKSQGAVEVELALNSEIGYSLAADASTVYLPSAQAAQEQSRLLDELLASPAGQRLVLLEDAQARSGQSGVIRVRMDRPAWYGIRLAPQVRSILVAGLQTPARWPARAFENIPRYSAMELFLSVRTGKSYSPRTGYMSEPAIAVQRDAQQAVLDDLLGSLGTTLLGSQTYPDLGVAYLRVRRDGVEALYARRDPRIADISFNEGTWGVAPAGTTAD